MDPRKAARLDAPAVPSPRLMLILDLDNTLVHAAPESATTRTQYENLTHDVVRFTVPKDDTTGELYYKVKLRTGLAAFLARAHEVFDLAVYTHGLAGYVAQILKIIDPSGVYFNGRVVVRGLDFAMGDRIKKLELVPTLAERNQLHQALIVDDRDDVWEEEAIPCVLPTRPFYFFDTTAAISPLMQGVTKGLERYLGADPENGEKLDWSLNSTMVAVEKVRAEMARLGAYANVRQAVENVRMRILEGVIVVFAGGLIQEESSTQESALWKTAKALGATCLAEFIEEMVTHVVAGPSRSETVQNARGSQHGIHVVNPNWLFECLYRSERVLEEDYPLTDGVPHAPLERQPSASWSRGAAGGEGAAVRRTDPRVDPRLANNTRIANDGSLAGPSPPGNPRGRSAPQAAWPRAGPPMPPKLPLHELEACLDAELCKLVGPSEHTTLLGHIKRVRDEDADQSDRESSLTSIVQMVGPENIELICLQLGFFKPSDKPTKLLNPSGQSNDGR
ncbi:NLI interacting factor-like phosphatase-domain-containing protein [Pavlovales sp. CCMP2436]|nr:NLI interacting factor-like phosphatase-domain-containing protein [Pavlovales sp. CCMP2436]